METLFNSFLLVFVGEMGDKTQLLSLILVARYRKPWTILFGVFIATLLNHALAAYAGGWVAAQIPREYLKWGLAFTFFAFALWILVPDKEGELKSGNRFGVLMTTIVAFFIAEMGDKTQLATIALGARYPSAALVTVGTTMGMLGSNALAVFLGDAFLKRVPMKAVRIVACALFVIFGVMILIYY